ncbi:class I SAM-dependent methyltransferase [Azovibrio restrictus]|uniref:class I SAM-dependent methyltransferase n=1 Tax=Azovibrio restrictus TaxID=146938 RepID=UPI0003F9A56A|nr:class I SAM-dependent methyltransferase [Azovibrio restrictus]
MSPAFLPTLLDEASLPFKQSGRFAYHYARGKLSSDCIFRELLRQGIFPARGHFLDLGCGQGSLFGWLLAARRLYERGEWPADWAPPPEALSLRGIELMQKDVDRARLAFGAEHPLVRIEQGDMCQADFGQADVITILDALHYFNHQGQQDVLERIRRALPPGGLFLTRVGDAAAGLPHHLCNWVDQAVTFVRGHRLPRLYCRPLGEWVALLQALGFQVRNMPMNQGKPFANIMLICRLAP